MAGRCIMDRRYARGYLAGAIAACRLSCLDVPSPLPRLPPPRLNLPRRKRACHRARKRDPDIFIRAGQRFVKARSLDGFTSRYPLASPRVSRFSLSLSFSLSLCLANRSLINHENEIARIYVSSVSPLTRSPVSASRLNALLNEIYDPPRGKIIRTRRENSEYCHHARCSAR